jgi:hypothetical protein
MSGESTDSESMPMNNNTRSRSLLRQVRASLIGRTDSRYQMDTIGESSSVLLRRSFDNIDIQKPRSKQTSRPNTPISFSHRLSLFKSHIIGSRKYRRTVPSTWNDDDDDDFQSAPSVMSNSVCVIFFNNNSPFF